MDTVTYPEVAGFLTERFVPVKVKILEDPKMATCYGVNWTPTFIVTDAEGKEHYRFFGFFPSMDFMARLTLAEGYAKLNLGQCEAAAKNFEEVATRFSEAESAPEAIYMCGVAKYKGGGGNRDLLVAEWRKLVQKFPNSEWAKKASFAVE